MIPFDDQLSCLELSQGVAYLRSLMDQWGSKRPMLVTGRDSYEHSGARQLVEGVFGNREMPRFFRFSPNCTLEDLEQGLRYFWECSPDCIIAVGGGSVMDMGKLLAYCGGVSASPSELISGQVQRPDTPNNVPVVAIPTTAGTGSEATHFAVLYVNGIKHSVADSSMTPKAFALIPELLESNSPYTTACAGMDALSQGIESFWAVKGTDESKTYASRAVRMCSDWLEQAVLHPNPESRRNMLQAAHWAGRAINISTTTAPHALSYVFTHACQIPHGHAVSITLSNVFRSNADVTAANCNDPRGKDYVQSVMAELCGLLGVANVEAAATRIESLKQAIGLNDNWLNKQRMGAGELAELVVNGVNLQRLGNNPRRLDGVELKRIVEKSLRDAVSDIPVDQSMQGGSDVNESKQ